MDASVTDYSKLWQVHGALVRLLNETAMIVVGADILNGWIDPADLQSTASGSDAQRGALRIYSDKVYALGQDERLGLEVREGALSTSAYLGICQVVWDGLATLQKEAGGTAFRFSQVWGEIVVPTAVTVQAKVEAAADSASESFWPLLVAVVVIVVAIAVIKVA